MSEPLTHEFQVEPFSTNRDWSNSRNEQDFPLIIVVLRWILHDSYLMAYLLKTVTIKKRFAERLSIINGNHFHSILGSIIIYREMVFFDHVHFIVSFLISNLYLEIFFGIFKSSFVFFLRSMLDLKNSYVLLLVKEKEKWQRHKAQLNWISII